MCAMLTSNTVNTSQAKDEAKDRERAQSKDSLNLEHQFGHARRRLGATNQFLNGDVRGACKEAPPYGARVSCVI